MVERLTERSIEGAGALTQQKSFFLSPGYYFLRFYAAGMEGALLPEFTMGDKFILMCF